MRAAREMYIEEITLEGFKSYATRVTVPAFDPFFNAITGLNGSGKSNILDSICFVLGITNLSQARPAWPARSARSAPCLPPGSAALSLVLTSTRASPKCGACRGAANFRCLSLAPCAHAPSLCQYSGQAAGPARGFPSGCRGAEGPSAHRSAHAGACEQPAGARVQAGAGGGHKGERVHRLQ